jgi:hypothetical protein
MHGCVCIPTHPSTDFVDARVDTRPGATFVPPLRDGMKRLASGHEDCRREDIWPGVVDKGKQPPRVRAASGFRTKGQRHVC